MSKEAATTVAAATLLAPTLAAHVAVLKTPNAYNVFRHRWMLIFAGQRGILDYVLTGSMRNHYLGLPPDAPAAVLYPRPDIPMYGDDDVQYTERQLDLITKIFNMLDAFKTRFLGCLPSCVIITLRTRMNPEVAELGELVQALDEIYLAAGLRCLPALIADLRKGTFPSLSDFVYHINYLEALQVFAARRECPIYFADQMCAALLAMGQQQLVEKYFERLGTDPNDSAFLLQYIETYLKVLARLSDTGDAPAAGLVPLSSGLLNPVFASPPVPNAALVAQIGSLSTQLAELTVLMATLTAVQAAAPAAAPAAAKFCSTHGPGNHASAQCDHKSTGHNMKDTAASWSNKAQYDAYAAARKARKPRV